MQTPIEGLIAWLKKVLHTDIWDSYSATHGTLLTMQSNMDANKDAINNHSDLNKSDIINAMQTLFEGAGEADFSSSDLLNGKKAYNGANLITGSMTNRAGTTIVASEATKDSDNVYLTVPSPGYYDGSSKISAPLSKIPINIVTVAYGKSYKGSVNVAEICPKYAELTVENFAVIPGGTWAWSRAETDSSTHEATGVASYSYDATTGDFTWNTGEPSVYHGSANGHTTNNKIMLYYA